MAVVEHNGIVKSVGEKSIDVEIIVSSACDGCHLKGACHSSNESKSRVVTIKDSEAGNYSVGETVTIYISEKLGAKVVAMTYINPLVICVLAIVILQKYGFSEPISALFSLLAILMYFFVLHLFRGKIGDKIDIKIKK